MHKTREFTNKVLEAIDNGLLDRDQVILACLGWMSEKSVEGMCEANCFFEHEEEDDQEDIDNPNWVGSRHHY